MLTSTGGLAALEPGSELRELARQFSEIALAEDFPCIFAAQAVLGADVFFAVHDWNVLTPDRVLQDLQELCDKLAGRPEAIAAIFVTEHEQTSEPTLAEDLTLARRIIRAVIQHGDGDRRPRADHRDPSWTLRLDGVELFVNFSSPRHRARRSRNLGAAFTVLAQGRAAFERKGRGGDAARNAIRARLREYDLVPPHPALGTFGTPGNRESHQYFLGDGEQPIDVVAE
jgi:FPC/CPF motif-containing protein YcgG